MKASNESSWWEDHDVRTVVFGLWVALTLLLDVSDFSFGDEMEVWTLYIWLRLLDVVLVIYFYTIPRVVYVRESDYEGEG